MEDTDKREKDRKGRVGDTNRERKINREKDKRKKGGY